jgi:hypothetical protein
MHPVLILTGAAVAQLDRGAGEVANSIANRRGANGVAVIGAIELATARWSHRITDGEASTTVQLQNGITLAGGEIGAVLNLVRSLPAVSLRRGSERDRVFADAELQALFVSFLRGLPCPVVNDVDGQGPIGMWSALRWAKLAHQCQLETVSCCITTGTGLLSDQPPPVALPEHTLAITVVGEMVIGAPSDDLAGRCLDLARVSGCRLLGLTFVSRHGSAPQLLAADPFPTLTGAVADEVANLLCELSSNPDRKAASCS